MQTVTNLNVALFVFSMENDETLLPFERIKREILVKKDSATNPDYGSIPESRPIERLIEYGIVNVNKPPGPTSHQVSDYTKKILGLKKAGHSGTLVI